MEQILATDKLRVEHCFSSNSQLEKQICKKFPGYDNIVHSIMKFFTFDESTSDSKCFERFLSESKTGLLLHGPTGVGKSELVKDILKLMKIPAVCMNIADIFEPSVGESEKNIKKLIHKMKELIIFSERNQNNPNFSKLSQIFDSNDQNGSYYQENGRNIRNFGFIMENIDALSVNGDNMTSSNTRIEKQFVLELKQIVSEFKKLNCSADSRFKVQFVGITNNIKGIDNSLRNVSMFPLELEMKVPVFNQRKEIYRNLFLNSKDLLFDFNMNWNQQQLFQNLEGEVSKDEIFDAFLESFTKRSNGYVTSDILKSISHFFCFLLFEVGGSSHKIEKKKAFSIFWDWVFSLNVLETQNTEKKSWSSQKTSSKDQVLIDLVDRAINHFFVKNSEKLKALSVVSLQKTTENSSSSNSSIFENSKLNAIHEIGGDSYIKIAQRLKIAIQTTISSSNSMNSSEILMNSPNLLSLNAANGILLFGPPGTGKTFIIKSVVSEFFGNLNFLNVSSTDILSKLVGQSAKTLSALFDKARSCAPCVLFFDSFEAIARKREYSFGDNSSNTNSESDQMLSTLLVEMDGIENGKNKGILVLAATNRKDLLDPAILRPGRIDLHFELKVPNGAKEIWQILKKKLSKIPIDENELFIDFGFEDIFGEIETKFDFKIEEKTEKFEEKNLINDQKQFWREIVEKMLGWTAAQIDNFVRESVMNCLREGKVEKLQQHHLEVNAGHFLN